MVYLLLWAKGGGNRLEVTDKKLIKLCKSGHIGSFDLLLKRYEKYIYKICFNYTSSREDALDLLQEIFIKLYRSIQKFDEDRDIIPWLKRITVNTCLNFIRGKRDVTFSLDSTVGDSKNSVQDLIASGTDVEELVSMRDTKRLVEEIVQQLPDEMRMAIILRHVEGMSYDEIAKAMSCPVGTIKTHIFQGRKLLKDYLKDAGIWEV